MNFDEIFSGFEKLKVAIIGDVMLDAYTIGKVNRISPEAPVPVVFLEKEEQRIGGAGNVALNLRALGAETFLCSVIGVDKAAKILLGLLEESSINQEAMIQLDSRKTTIKTRVIANHQHLLRIDQEDTHSIDETTETLLIEAAKKIIDKGIDALIFEDYNKGVLTPKVIQELTTYANGKGVFITVDPKKDNFLSYKNVSLFKPNLKELKEGLNLEIDINKDSNALSQASAMLQKELNNALTFITLSERGVYITDGETPHHIEAHVRDIADVSGAGDTVIAVATLCLASKLSPLLIAEISNIAGGLVCEHSGVVRIDKEQLLFEVKTLLNPRNV
ncbi:MAG: D-glycero-beta-D-manno-heptose-7-phosphate kinase [Flavobacteriia bacterium]|nr:D-glycero-beta-D-manno-heptose-7-phosphate kinase [Flavobacteriia bacterium]